MLSRLSSWINSLDEQKSPIQEEPIKPIYYEYKQVYNEEEKIQKEQKIEEEYEKIENYFKRVMQSSDLIRKVFQGCP